ncbi:hypothetical protein [Larkinella rosea]|uniref:hypothetical protein n=1 Tax=Larkinella rosea TaxID=2025312 RepID=UPI00163A02E2|nr:hypothetical protein [Larkinella rosea]
MPDTINQQFVHINARLRAKERLMEEMKNKHLAAENRLQKEIDNLFKEWERLKKLNEEQ